MENKVKEFDLKLAKTISLIEESELFHDTSEICQGFSESHLLFLTSYLGITVAIAIADGQLYESEAEYIIKGIPKGIMLDEKMKNSLVQLNLSKAILAQGHSVTIPHYIAYLKNQMKEDDIVKVIKLLFSLGCADGELVPREEKLTIQIARRFGLPDGKIKQIRDYCLKNKLTKKPYDKEINLINKLKNVEQHFDKKRFVKPLKETQIQEFSASLETSPLFFFFKKKCPGVKQGELLFITSFLGTAFSFISSDQEIHEKEVSYIAHQFSLWYNLESDTLSTLVDICIYLTEQNSHIERFNKIYLEILSLLFDNQEKERFTVMLFNLADSDGDLSSIELVTIEKISKAFNLSEEKVRDLKNQAIGIEGSFKILKSASTWDML